MPIKDLITVITCVYNSIGVARQALSALAEHSRPEDVEVILVDNHSPDVAVREFILDYERAHRNVRVLDPGKNIGCHDGFNAGYAHAHGSYVVKLDDDTVIQQDDWASKMREALDKVPMLGFVSADIDAKQANKYRIVEENGVRLEVADQGVVGFSCVMFRRSDIEKWGPMRVGAYYAAGGKLIANVERLYGGEEVHYANCARKAGKFLAHLPSVFVHHLGNEERHPDFAMWKRTYGYRGATDKDMVAWIACGEHVDGYMRELLIELSSPAPNDVLLMEWSKRLSEIGPGYCGELLLRAYEKTTNGVAKESIGQSMRRLHDRTAKAK